MRSALVLRWLATAFLLVVSIAPACAKDQTASSRLHEEIWVRPLPLPMFGYFVRPVGDGPSPVAAAAFVAAVSGAAARNTAHAASPAEVATRGQRETKDVTYGAWRKLCFRAGGAKTLCRTSITGTFPTGQMAVRVDLIEREGERGARLQLYVPSGMYLQPPVKLSVDRGSSYRVPYSWCAANACVAADVADPRIIKEMESGKILVLEVVDSNLLSLTTSLPLLQFAPVHKGAPAQTLEQHVDE